MSTTATKKITVEPKWNQTQVHEATVAAMANNWLAAYSVLGKFGEQAIKEFEEASRTRKIEYYKRQGVKTPIDLVKVIAEFEANVFGSKIEIEGDDKNATLTYNSCAMWNAMKKYGHFTPEQEEKMGHCFGSYIEHLAKEFGFKGNVEFKGDVAVMHFSK